MADNFYGGVRAGRTDVSIQVRLVDTTTNQGKTAVAHTDVTAYYYRLGAASATSITMASLTNLDDAHSDGGWKEVHATNTPGLYRFDVPDAAFAVGSDSVTIALKVSGAYEMQREFPLETRRSLRKGVAVDDFLVYLQNAAGTGITSGTPTCKRIIDGVEDDMDNAATHVADGVWKIDLTADDTGAGATSPVIAYKFAVTGAVTKVMTFVVEP